MDLPSLLGDRHTPHYADVEKVLSCVKCNFEADGISTGWAKK